MTWHDMTTQGGLYQAIASHVTLCHAMSCQGLLIATQTISTKTNMNTIKLSEPERVAIAQESIILKITLLGCIGLALVGWGIFTYYNHQTIAKSQPQATGKLDKATTPKTPPEPPLIITKKPNKPIVIEEGSEAWFCIKNNGGSVCLGRDRYAPNYRVVSPPPRVKTYDDYLVQYGVRGEGYCGRYFNGQPNCF